jgi:predicted enzyme related to lactoylglutathione lyase
MSQLEFWHHHLGVSVPDLEASIDWYRRVLGFELARRQRIETIPADVAILKHGAMATSTSPSVSPMSMRSRRSCDAAVPMWCG